MNKEDIESCLKSMNGPDVKAALKKTTEDALEYGVHTVYEYHKEVRVTLIRNTFFTIIGFWGPHRYSAFKRRKRLIFWLRSLPFDCSAYE